MRMTDMDVKAYSNRYNCEWFGSRDKAIYIRCIWYILKSEKDLSFVYVFVATELVSCTCSDLDYSMQLRCGYMVKRRYISCGRV